VTKDWHASANLTLMRSCRAEAFERNERNPCSLFVHDFAAGSVPGQGDEMLHCSAKPKDPM
jgi:hypothetical protein